MGFGNEDPRWSLVPKWLDKAARRREVHEKQVLSNLVSRHFHDIAAADLYLRTGASLDSIAGRVASLASAGPEEKDDTSSREPYGLTTVWDNSAWILSSEKSRYESFYGGSSPHDETHLRYPEPPLLRMASSAVEESRK